MARLKLAAAGAEACSSRGRCLQQQGLKLAAAGLKLAAAGLKLAAAAAQALSAFPRLRVPAAAALLWKA